MIERVIITLCYRKELQRTVTRLGTHRQPAAVPGSLGNSVLHSCKLREIVRRESHGPTATSPQSHHIHAGLRKCNYYAWTLSCAGCFGILKSHWKMWTVSDSSNLSRVRWGADRELDWWWGGGIATVDLVNMVNNRLMRERVTLPVREETTSGPQRGGH